MSGHGGRKNRRSQGVPAQDLVEWSGETAGSNPTSASQGLTRALAKRGSRSCCLVAALWAVERLATPQPGPLKLSPAGAAGQHLDLRQIHPHGARTGRSRLRLWIQLCSEGHRPLLQVRNRFGPSTVGPIDGEAAFRPPQRLVEVLRLLLANGHLPVELKHRHPAPLGQEGDSDAVHLSVVLAARLVVLLQG